MSEIVVNQNPKNNNNKEYKKLYREQNKIKIAEYARLYYHKKNESNPERLEKFNKTVQKNFLIRNGLETPRKVGRPIKVKL